MTTIKKYSQEINSFRQEQRNKQELGFNFFSIVTDFYYRENFHSDVLKHCLEIREFFEVFISFIQLDKAIASNFDFSNMSVNREKYGKIDISIIDLSSRNAIIIENKMNNAIDMPRQLPRYYDSLTNNGFKVIAIIYLSLTGEKYPMRHDWTSDDNKNLNTLIRLMSAIPNFKINLDTVLTQSILKSSNIEQIVLFRHYKNLLNFLAKEETNNKIMEDFFSKIQTKDDLENLIALRKLIDNLPKFRALKIRDHFKDNISPFSDILIWKDAITYFDKLLIGSANFAIDVSCSIDKYEVSLFDRMAKDNISVIELNEKFKLEFKKQERSLRIHQSFSYPDQESDLYHFIDEVLKKLRNQI